ncbi:hypothetical protein RHGRI_007324 [Rhododendron griersonianum]|uniref:GDSL esterase/lipase n=1 Tax=Rhododendron griersonianum TaxID=479676 RepID=A0AAV6KYB9_9ERIC|nr:hypothetical protein RHGRI_007324 [Rhododendron griersonianum]
MDKLLPLFLCLLPSVILVEIEALIGTYKPQDSHVKLFVFGDSYVDTGNTPKAFSKAWKSPYGITYPGKPAGRFSDGRVLTDYIAQYLSIPSPVPYRQRKFGKKLIRYGMNFAYGGAGVFDTSVRQHNLTTQIGNLEQLIAQKVYLKNDMEFSIALVSLAGSDYATYLNKKGSVWGFPDFAVKLINQLVWDVKRIHELGVRKIGVVSIEPMGCLPRFTGPASFQYCDENVNIAAQSHNLLLLQALNRLRIENGARQGSDIDIVVLDLYTAFMFALETTGYYLLLLLDY